MGQQPVTERQKATVQQVMVTTDVFLQEFVIYVDWYLELQKAVTPFPQHLFVMQMRQLRQLKIQLQIKLHNVQHAKNLVIFI